MLCCVSWKALRRTFEHCGDATRGTTREEAALLYGWPCVDRTGRRFTVVSLAVPAITSASATHVVIHEESFLRAAPEVAREENSVRGRRPILVGWAHSHPFDGPGSIFMSGTDRETMRLFFPLAHQVGIVLDPKSGHWSAFGWRREEVAEIPHYLIDEPDWKRHFWASEVPA